MTIADPLSTVTDRLEGQPVPGLREFRFDRSQYLEGLEPATSFPHAIVPGVTLSLRNGGRQITLSYPTPGESPDREAVVIAQAVLDTPPTEWPVTFRGGYVAEWEEHPDL